MESLTHLEESTGLAGRQPGAVFKNSNGDQLTFNELQFYPTGGGRFEPDQLAIELKKFTNVQWLNKASPRTGGFGIATFTDQQDNVVKIGQYMEKIKPSFTQNYMPNTVLGYSLDTKSSKKTKEKLKPQDLLLAKKVNLSIADVMNQLAQTLGTDNVLYHVAHKIAMGHPLPIKFEPPKDITFEGFRDYFCEILQPIAIIKGQYTGNAAEAAEKFLGGSFQNTSITFDESVTAGLSDSILRSKSGKEVLISTKGGAGAKASAKNLYDKIVALEASPSGKELLSKFNDEVELIKNIIKSGQNGAPLYLGVKYKIITQKDADEIKSLRGQAPMNLDDIDSLGISSTLKRLATDRNTKTPQNTDLYFHILAEVAEQAAKVVNEKTNFSKAATDLLNNGALVQVYTKAKQGKNEWILEEFNTVYPSDNIKGVYLSASKTYYSTDIKGNFTFKIDKGSGVPKDEPDVQVDVPSEIDVEKNKKKSRAAVTDIFRGDSEEVPRKDSKAGRERR
jgi:hypothetical protein